MRKTIKIIFLMIVMLLIITNYSYAAIQIKDTTDATTTNGTISTFYVVSKEMKNTGQGLEGSSVNVKMANNYEWAVVSYFSNSDYGTGGAGENTGVDFGSHKSTNGNVTGVMDWGKNTTFTAGIISSYASKTLTTAGGSAIINDAETSAVDKFDYYGEKTDLKNAKTGWYGVDWNWSANEGTHPYSARKGLFGFAGGVHSTIKYGNSASGAASSDITFRPVFYAQ